MHMAVKRKLIIVILTFSSSFLILSNCYSTTDTLVQGKPLRDWEHLVSANNTFTLGFFSDSTSDNRYLGIWYTKLPPVKVWVANSNDPIPNTSGNLIIDHAWKLRITYKGSSIAVSNQSHIATNTTAIIQDNGNFILREHMSDGKIQILWQSFDYPTDTLLPGMKIGINLRNGHEWSLTSWRSIRNPGSGDFSLGADFHNQSQLVARSRGNKIYWTSGFWHNESLTFDNLLAPLLSDDDHRKDRYRFRYISNKEERYFSFHAEKSVVFPRLVLQSTGALHGGFGIFIYCEPDSEWQGCVKPEMPKCRKPESQWFEFSDGGYEVSEGFKLDHNMTLSDCRFRCWHNCSCVAFSADFVTDIGCVIWSTVRPRKDLVGKSQKLYVLLQTDKVARKMWWIWLITGGGGLVIILLASSLCCLGWKKLKLQEENKRQQELLFELGAVTKPFTKYNSKNHEKGGKKTNELQLFSFQSLAAATNNFSIENKLGEGGFGPVYKGKLIDGQEIAIKRLSKSSRQGLVEFKNEIALIAKLQHDNLVKLLGCSIKEEEKILIYEYLPNKSLDFFLFDPSKKNSLNWKERYNIIEGITQGLLYLHKYSRLRVIHRDLKASNILLDKELNPKISDFGMARIFGRDECEANTNRVVGTYGYMSPEYAMQGIFSTKSDVFSFGVLLLEIVSGRKNYSNYHDERPLNLIGYAWELWTEGKDSELMDQTSCDDSSPNNVVKRCIHVGLLCVQENPKDRPTMSDVVLMLANEGMQLSVPKQPAFLIRGTEQELEISKRNLENCSLNSVSISVMEGR